MLARNLGLPNGIGRVSYSVDRPARKTVEQMHAEHRLLRDLLHRLIVATRLIRRRNARPDLNAFALEVAHESSSRDGECVGCIRDEHHILWSCPRGLVMPGRVDHAGGGLL